MGDQTDQDNVRIVLFNKNCLEAFLNKIAKNKTSNILKNIQRKALKKQMTFAFTASDKIRKIYLGISRQIQCIFEIYI